MKKIETLDELKKKASEDRIEVFIMLNGGLRSSKDLDYNEESDTWFIFNHVDDTEQELHTKELGVWTNIMKALKNGALYEY